MHCCGVRTKSPLHSVICYQPCPRRRLLTITPPTVDGGAAHTLRLKLHRFDFSPCLLQTCLYIDSESIMWSLSIIVQVCANNRHFLVCLEFAINRRSLPGNYTSCSLHYGRLLPCDAMLYLSVRLSVCVCVSVTLRYCVKTAKHRITQIMPHDRPGTLIFK